MPTQSRYSVNEEHTSDFACAVSTERQEPVPCLTQLPRRICILSNAHKRMCVSFMLHPSWEAVCRSLGMMSFDAYELFHFKHVTIIVIGY